MVNTLNSSAPTHLPFHFPSLVPWLSFLFSIQPQCYSNPFFAH
jgi:hypothetical protein